MNLEDFLNLQYGIRDANEEEGDPYFKPLQTKFVSLMKPPPGFGPGLEGPVSKTKRSRKPDVTLKYNGELMKAHREVLIEAIKPLQTKFVSLMKPPPGFGPGLEGPVSKTKRSRKPDVTLKYNGELMKAHREVLIEASEFFKKVVFQSKPEPRGARGGAVKSTRKRKATSEVVDLNARNVLPQGISEATVNKVIDFAYTGQLPLPPNDEAVDFFITAVSLRFGEAIDVYGRYLIQLNKGVKRELSHTMLATLLSQSQMIRLPFVLSECAEHLSTVFDHTCQYVVKEPLEKLMFGNKEFVKMMSFHGMKAFLSRNDLAKPKDEIKVLDLALAWLKYDEKSRQQHAQRILKKIRLGLVPRDSLASIIPAIEGFPGCKEIVEEVLKLIDTKDEATVQLKFSHSRWFANRKEVPVNTLIGIGPATAWGGQTMRYFNAYGREKYLGWQDWCNFESIPHENITVNNSSVLPVDGKLYIAGGCATNIYNRRAYRVSSRGRMVNDYKWNMDFVHEGNLNSSGMQFSDEGGQLSINMVNPWTTLPPLKEPRAMFPMVHLDGFLYALGGEDDKREAMREAERYSFQAKKWERIANIPVPCYYACATTYKGMILVYGSQPVPNEDTPAQHNLQMYDPVANTWHDLLKEHHKIVKYKRQKEESEINAAAAAAERRRHLDEDEYGSEEEEEDMAEERRNKEIGRTLPRNVLVVDGDDCFRVVYPKGDAKKEFKPVVHQLEFDLMDDTPSVMLGQQVDQTMMPTSGEGAFQINGNVFVNVKGAIQNTGIKVPSGQVGEVDLGVWKKVKVEAEEGFSRMTFATLEFDKKTVFCENCAVGKECVEIECETADSDTWCESDSDY